VPCPLGKYGAKKTKKEKEADCDPCPGGYYCDVVGLNHNRLYDIYGKKCWAGYYCTKGAIVPYPTDGTTGNICPKGHFCEGGNTVAVKCAAAIYTGIAPISGTLNLAGGAKNYAQD
jgi:hypothetical protein